MCVDRCVCFEVRFVELKAHVQQHGGTLASLRTTFGCGQGCAMCVPYVAAMLETGRTSFEPGEVVGTSTIGACNRLADNS